MNKLPIYICESQPRWSVLVRYACPNVMLQEIRSFTLLNDALNVQSHAAVLVCVTLTDMTPQRLEQLYLLVQHFPHTFWSCTTDAHTASALSQIFYGIGMQQILTAPSDIADWLPRVRSYRRSIAKQIEPTTLFERLPWRHQASP
jgi:hypothetical protein